MNKYNVGDWVIIKKPDKIWGFMQPGQVWTVTAISEDLVALSNEKIYNNPVKSKGWWVDYCTVRLNNSQRIRHHLGVK